RYEYGACPLCGDGDEASLVPFVVSPNLKRRHLDESQRAMVAANIARLPLGANQHTASANLPTQAEAATMLNVSERTVRSARQVRDDGAPELVQAVEQGKVSVSAAAMTDGGGVAFQRRSTGRRTGALPFFQSNPPL